MKRSPAVLWALCLTLTGCPQPATDTPAAGDATPEFSVDQYLEGIAGEAVTHWIAEEPVASDAPPVDPAMLADPHASAERWLHYTGDYRGYRHSPIQSVTPQSVNKLRVAWGLSTGTDGQFGVSPVVYGGIMYVTTTYNRLFAVDARTGDILWRYDHQLPEDLRICCGPVSRGAAIHGNRVFMGTLDAKLLAFDRRTGAIDWEVEVDAYQNGISITSAPLVLDDRLIVGMAGSEFGVRSYFDAYDVETGKRLWRHYTVPAEGEPGAETWADESFKTGGAATWHPGAYDPQTDTVFWPTGNPGPDFSGATRKGDNLYSNSILAVDARTGARKWHFQTTPHDIWDFDGNTQLFLIDVERDGETIPGLVQANRNGYFYILDRRDGSFLGAEAYVEQMDWATIDASGRPVVSEHANSGDEVVCPGGGGGMNAAWTGALNPKLGLAYIPSTEACATYIRADAPFVRGLPYMGGTPVLAEGEDAYGNLAAIDVTTGQVRWRHREDDPIMAGVLSTAGGVVFTGNIQGDALAINAENGELLWSFRTGSSVRGQPIAFELDGEPYVVIPSGAFPGGQAVTVGSQMTPGGSQLYVFKIRKDELSD